MKTKNINLIKQKITGFSKSQLFLNPKIDIKFQEKIDLAIERLENGEPIEYILNNAEFYSLDFYVDDRVLIPRDDTEIMVNKAIESIINYNKTTLIDVGTGSSCIPISILKNTSKVDNSYVIDISENALEISKINIKKHHLINNIKQINGNLLQEFLLNNTYNLNKNIIITANLPYIKNEDYENIDKETIEFEPALALYGGKETGFELYEQLIDQCFELKSLYNIKNIILFIEIGFDQKEYSSKYLNNLNLKLKFEIFKDNSDIERCVKIEF